MRLLFNPQKALDFFSFPKSRSKEINKYEEKYDRISKLLDENISILKAIGKDLGFDKKEKKGRKGYTVEQSFRCILIKKLEGFSYREAVIEIHDRLCFRKFCRLENEAVMDYSELNKLATRISFKTWDKVNGLLDKYAVEKELISGEKLRTDTTAVETNIHYPTDSSMLWDVYRVFSRFIKGSRNLMPEVVGDVRAHNKKYKKIYFSISRLAGKKTKKPEMKERYGKLIIGVEQIISTSQRIIEEGKEAIKSDPLSDESLKMKSLIAVAEADIVESKKIVDQAERRVMAGEKVPNDEKVFSLFEPHTELLKRGKAGKPVEFGHMVLLNQVADKYITGYEVFEKKPNENQLVDKILKEHEKLFGHPPELFAADKGFYESMEKLKKLEEEIEVVAIGKKGRLNEEEQQRESVADFIKGNKFRAGIEGSISGLKRILSMGRCMDKGFERFRSFVSGIIFAHNLRILATL